MVISLYPLPSSFEDSPGDLLLSTSLRLWEFVRTLWYLLLTIGLEDFQTLLCIVTLPFTSPVWLWAMGLFGLCILMILSIKGG